ncbi:MAG: lysophospholipid acyltransferase family protein [Nocardioides sp.]|uniref:lysophospholipid acyltransferase family protein n=1 Tax=Nocardioides sp. TaxID=35761 RepID=UPI0039E45825
MSAHQPERQAADGAEVIPIGTRGRPGRGTGQRPSSAARGLVGGGSKPAPKPVPKPSAGTKPTVVKQPVAAPAPSAPAAPYAESPVVAHERTGPLSPLSGIPVSDWLAALTYASRELFGDEWEPRLAQFLAFLRRRVTGDFSVDTYGFDAELTQRFFLTALRPIAQKWFRIEVIGAENIPAEGGALVVSNHSGTIPLDGVMTLVQIHDHTGRFLRPLGADLVFRLPFVGTIARKAGATLACNEDAERMLRDGELVGVWPEGFKGIGKPFSERYKLQRFGRGGFVSAAIRTGVPIVPVSVVGAEEIYPLVGNIPALARILGLPYLPITPLFPLLGPLGLVPLPSKWLIEFGEPIRTDAYDKGAADDPMLVFNVTDQVRETIQQTLFHLLQQRQSVFR